jgi:hypothetical protein
MGKVTEQGSPLMQPLLVPLMKAEEWRGRGILTTPLFILTIACFVCYANTVSCGFVFDDISAIKDNKAREQEYNRLVVLFSVFWFRSYGLRIRIRILLGFQWVSKCQFVFCLLSYISR